MKIKGEYNSVWDGGYVITTSCSIDLDTGIVTPKVASDDETAEVNTLDREYIEVLGQEFEVEEKEGDYFVNNLDGLRELVAASVAPKRPKASAGMSLG